MFNKTANTPSVPPTPQPQPQPPQPPIVPPEPAVRRPTASATPARAASLIGPDIVFDGHISGEGELLIEGSVRGEVQVARLVVGERAQVEGSVRGAVVEVRGRVVGNIEAKSIKLYESAHVEGDISHEQLSIEVGAFFEGRCAQLRPAPQVHQPKPAPAVQPAPAPKVVELDKNVG